MHFEVLVEDESTKVLLEEIFEGIIGNPENVHSWRVISYRGIGHIPQNLTEDVDPQKRLLLTQLPRLLRGYGKSLNDFPSTVVVLVDLDNRNCLEFKDELVGLLEGIRPCPNVLFRIAIEEVEAWLLGDFNAIKAAYPRFKNTVLLSYEQDSICGTWEILADAVHAHGSLALNKLGYPEIGMAKCAWAERIGRYMDVERNQSKSFQVFRDGIRRLTL